MRPMIIGTRSSDLALRQTEIAVGALRQVSPNLAIDVVKIDQRGDDPAVGPAWRVDEPGLFTSGLTDALVSGRIDIAVHSLKDLPVDTSPGTRLGALLRREDPRDALVDRVGRTLAALPAGARVGTSSLRRRANILARRPDLEVVEIRGNVPSRLAAVSRRDVDAVVIAVAGLARLNRVDQASEIFNAGDWLPAAGQGAIALETRDDDTALSELLAKVDDRSTRRSTLAERSLVQSLGAGCGAPVSALAMPALLNDGMAWTLTAEVLSLDGRTRVRSDATASVPDDGSAEALGALVALRLHARGAAALIEAARQEIGRG